MCEHQDSYNALILLQLIPCLRCFGYSSLCKDLRNAETASKCSPVPFENLISLAGCCSPILITDMDKAFINQLNRIRECDLTAHHCSTAQSHQQVFRRALVAELKEEWEESEARLTEWSRARLQVCPKTLVVRLAVHGW